MGTLSKVGVVLAVVGVLFVGIGWNRYQHDSRANDWRRQRIDQAQRMGGDGALYAARVPPYPETLWLAVTVVAGSMALAGVGLAIAGRRQVREGAVA